MFLLLNSFGFLDPPARILLRVLPHGGLPVYINQVDPVIDLFQRFNEALVQHPYEHDVKTIDETAKLRANEK